MSITLAESRTLNRITVTEKSAGSGLWRVRIIDAGMGSSGFYPAATLEAAVGLFNAGTQMFLDHATEQEDWERPEGSLERLVGALAADAEWNPAANAIEADVRVYPHWRALLAEMTDDIGLSIRARGIAEVQDMGGRPVPVITELSEVLSVDYVTRAGRGGRVLQVMESASTRIPEALRLITETTSSTAAGSEPTIPPSGGDTTTHLKESNVEITKDEYDRLKADAARVSALEAERDTANTKAAEAAAALAERERELGESRRVAAQTAIGARIDASELAEAAKARLKKQFTDAIDMVEADVDAAIRDEADYAKQLIESAAQVKTPMQLGNGPATITENHTPRRTSPWGTDYSKEA